MRVNVRLYSGTYELTWGARQTRRVCDGGGGAMGAHTRPPIVTDADAAPKDSPITATL